MRKTIYLKCMAWILCISVLFSTDAFGFPAVSAAGPKADILLDGNPVSDIKIEQNEKKILTAETYGIDAAYQWQLLLDTQQDEWIHIQDKTNAECEVSYALLKNALDKNGTAHIRCAADIGGETVYSGAVCVSVLPQRPNLEQVTFFDKGWYMSSEEGGTEKRRSPARRAADAEYATITIQYLDISSLTGEETAVYNPYIATIEKGSSFSGTIVSPAFLGYAPYYAAGADGLIDDDAAQIKLDYPAVNENTVIKVYYKPIKVNFAVRYFFQNIRDDFYTEDVTRYHTGQVETGTIISNKYLEQNAGDTVGFEKMYHSPASVAADGSTVFECYYDRVYSLIRLDLDGGYGVDPIYARYGSSFVVNTPTKYGYTFAGWDLVITDTDGDGIPDKGDGKADDMIGTIGAENRTYIALWESVDTTYTVAYWSESSGGAQYLGARRVSGKSGEYVSGWDDLKDTAGEIYRYDEHIHSEEAGCYGACPFGNHRHDIQCYTSSQLKPASEQTGNIRTAFNNLQAAVSNPISGNIYKYAYRAVWQTTYYNFFYFDGTWYYLGTGDSYMDLNGVPDKPAQNTYTTVEAAVGTGCATGGHKHTDDCLSCTKLAHVHTEVCNPNPQFYTFDRADQKKLIEGDGSTIVNVYYKPKEYTLRFFYARSYVDEKQIDPETNTNKIVYQVVGGSTYPFGGGASAGANSANDTVDDLLSKVQEWGNVKTLPKWYENTQLSGSTSDISHYTLGEREIGNYTYYYFDFTASYGDDISTKWPIGILSPVETEEKHNHEYQYTDQYGNVHTQKITADEDYEYAYFSAWNGEFKVKYTQDNQWCTGKGTKNETIKGRYMKLDENLLYDGEILKNNSIEEGNVVNYLGFWDNGAAITWSVPKLFRYHLMLEAPPGVVTDYEYDGKYYTQFQEFRTFDDSTVASQTPTAIDGFECKKENVTWTRNEDGYTSVMGETLRDAYDVYFHYERNDYTVTYFNYENVLDSVTVPYGTLFSTSDYYKEPWRYPPSLEPDAYGFVGWYTTPGRIAGTEVEFDQDTMPAEDVVWYAKWVKKTRTVNFFTTYDEMTSYEAGKTLEPYSIRKVTHNTVVGSIPNPTKTDNGISLIFSGWFYMENGEKKAFTPLVFPINKDMNIFAEWSSSSPQPYRIQYVLQSDPLVKVADDTAGYAFSGTTRTFIAKTGSPENQLYGLYNKGYFPTVSSHSITIQTEKDDAEPARNVYTFYYAEAANVAYKVRYVDKTTGRVLAEEDQKNTSNAVVTERYKTIPGYVPDAFYKRLVLSVVFDAESGKYVGSDDNIITFYYMPNETQAYYAVHYMTEKQHDPSLSEAEIAALQNRYNTDGTGGYEEVTANAEGIAKINDTVAVTPPAIPGFALAENQALIRHGEGTENACPYLDGSYKISVSPDGTELFLFYRRNVYPYSVHYYIYNTETTLHDSKTKEVPYGTAVTETAEAIDGYTCVSAETQTVTVRDNEKENIIIFYYMPIQYVVEYVAVPPEGGRLSNTIRIITSTDTPEGSVPTANPYYAFAGWYLDKDCTQGVGEYGTVDPETHRFTPDKSKLSDSKRNVFYAKFVLQSGHLTIYRGDAEDSGQVFVYEIKSHETGDVYYATVTGGNKSVTIRDLPFGEYTVTQQNDWSWRYRDEAVEVTHQDPNGTTVHFSEKATEDKWLNGHSDLIRNQRGPAQ